MKKALAIFLALAMLACAVPALAVSVVRSPQNLTVDGRAVQCDKYNIDGSNFFKLRDIARLLSGTASQFEVGFADGVVSITTGLPYTENGSELIVGEDLAATAVPSAQTIRINGQTRGDLAVYNIGGNNFFKLRDLGGALGFGVDYDASSNTAVVRSGGSAPAMSEGMTESYSGVCQYFTTFLLNKDRTRYQNAAKGFDWTQMPMDTGRYLTLAEEFGANARIGKPDLMPVTADLDGDGNKEILFSNYDGCVHCFNLDKTEKGSWPYHVDQNVLSFASRPVVADLDGDGRPEVIIGTFVDQTQTAVRGELIVLDGSGSVRARITVPTMWGLNGAEDTLYANCIIGMPAVADVDGDGRPEIIVNTKNSGVCVYKVG